jgi:hypothetical protein
VSIELRVIISNHKHGCYYNHKCSVFSPKQNILRYLGAACTVISLFFMLEMLWKAKIGEEFGYVDGRTGM